MWTRLGCRLRQWGNSTGVAIAGDSPSVARYNGPIKGAQVDSLTGYSLGRGGFSINRKVVLCWLVDSHSYYRPLSFYLPQLVLPLVFWLYINSTTGIFCVQPLDGLRFPRLGWSFEWNWQD